MSKVYNNIWAGGRYLPTGKQAYVKLLAKKGKDPADLGSYCPISLLNIDVKIFSKIIATLFADIILDLI